MTFSELSKEFSSSKVMEDVESEDEFSRPFIPEEKQDEFAFGKDDTLAEKLAKLEKAEKSRVARKPKVVRKVRQVKPVETAPRIAPSEEEEIEFAPSDDDSGDEFGEGPSRKEEVREVVEADDGTVRREHLSTNESTAYTIVYKLFTTWAAPDDIKTLSFNDVLEIARTEEVLDALNPEKDLSVEDVEKSLRRVVEVVRREVTTPTSGYLPRPKPSASVQRSRAGIVEVGRIPRIIPQAATARRKIGSMSKAKLMKVAAGYGLKPDKEITVKELRRIIRSQIRAIAKSTEETVEEKLKQQRDEVEKMTRHELYKLALQLELATQSATSRDKLISMIRIKLLDIKLKKKKDEMLQTAQMLDFDSTDIVAIAQHIDKTIATLPTLTDRQVSDLFTRLNIKTKVAVVDDITGQIVYIDIKSTKGSLQKKIREKLTQMISDLTDVEREEELEYQGVEPVEVTEVPRYSQFIPSGERLKQIAKAKAVGAKFEVPSRMKTIRDVDKPTEIGYARRVRMKTGWVDVPKMKWVGETELSKMKAEDVQFNIVEEKQEDEYKIYRVQWREWVKIFTPLQTELELARLEPDVPPQSYVPREIPHTSPFLPIEWEEPVEWYVAEEEPLRETVAVGERPPPRRMVLHRDDPSVLYFGHPGSSLRHYVREYLFRIMSTILELKTTQTVEEKVLKEPIIDYDQYYNLRFRNWWSTNYDPKYTAEMYIQGFIETHNLDGKSLREIKKYIEEIKPTAFEQDMLDYISTLPDSELDVKTSLLQAVEFALNIEIGQKIEKEVLKLSDSEEIVKDFVERYGENIFFGTAQQIIQLLKNSKHLTAIDGIVLTSLSNVDGSLHGDALAIVLAEAFEKGRRSYDTIDDESIRSAIMFRDYVLAPVKGAREVFETTMGETVRNDYSKLIGVKVQAEEVGDILKEELIRQINVFEANVYSKHSDSVLDYLRHVLLPSLFLSGELSDYAKLFTESIEKRRYTADKFTTMELPDYFPELFTRDNVPQSALDRIDRLLQYTVDRTIVEYEEQAHTLRYALKMPSSIGHFDWERMIANPTEKCPGIVIDRLVIAYNTDIGTFTCHDEQELLKQFLIQNYTNPLTGVQFDDDFVERILQRAEVIH